MKSHSLKIELSSENLRKLQDTATGTTAVADPATGNSTADVVLPPVIDDGPDDNVKTALIITSIVLLTFVVLGFLILLCLYSKGIIKNSGYEITG